MRLPRHKQQSKQACAQQYTRAAAFQRNAQIAYQAFWLRTGTLPFPFEALTIPCVSCGEISAVGTDVMVRVQQTHSPETETLCLTCPRGFPYSAEDLKQIFRQGVAREV